MTNWLDILPHCQPCGADWKDGACPECGEKLADLIDNYDGAPWFSTDHDSDRFHRQHIKQR